MDYPDVFKYELDEYNKFNQLVGVQSEKTTATYAYGADGLRISKTVGGVKTSQVWDGAYVVLELSAANAIQDRYVRGVGLIKSGISGYL